MQVPQYALDKPEINVDRAKIKAELLALANEFLEKFEDLDVVINEPENNYFAR